MRRLKEKLDPKYLKISMYVIFAAVVTFIICLILVHAQGFFADVWHIIKVVLKPIIWGGVICYLLTPITNFLIRHLNGKGEKQKGWVRPVAVVLTFLIVLGVIIGILLLLVFFLVKGVKTISFNDIFLVIDSIKKDFEMFSDGIKGLIAGFDFSLDNLESILTDLIGNLGKSFAGIIGSIPQAAVNLLFSFIFSLYFLLDGKRIGDYLKRVFKALFSENTVSKTKVLIKDADDVFSGYIRGKILDAIVLGIIISIAFTIAGVPYAVVSGVFIGLVIIIPYVGSAVSYLILLLAYIISGDLSRIWVGLIILTVLLVFEAYVLCPKLISASIVIHPLLIIVALIAGGAVGGLIGMLIAIPVVAFLKIQFDRYIERKEKSAA